MMTLRLRRLWLRLGQLGALALTVLAGVLDVREGLADRRGLGDAPLALLQVGLAMAAVALWLPVHQQGSRRLPQATLVLAAASLTVTALWASHAVDFSGGSWGLAETCGLIAVTFVVARRGTARWAGPAVAAAMLAVAALPLRSGTDNVYVAVGLLLALVTAGAAGSGAFLRLLAARREQAVAVIRAEQRAEFARELHDFVAHHVTGIVVQAQAARYVGEQDPRQMIGALEQIERAGAETMASMRRMVGVLRDGKSAQLAPLAGVADLQPLLDQFNSSTEMTAVLCVDGSVDGLPVEISTSAYRVVLEALTNARRHASGASTVNVLVRRTPDRLLVRVADDGAMPRGLASPGRGYGLIGLAERVRAVGGTISAEPGITGGWVVDAALPLKQRVAQ